MENGDKKTIKYLFWGIILVILVLSYFILKEFLIALASAFILAYLLKPINDRLAKKMPRRVAAMTSLIIVVFLILIIISSIVGTLISEISQLLSRNLAEELITNIKNLPYEEVITENLAQIVSKVGSVSLELVSSIVSEIPSKLVALFIVLFATYYLLVDWEKLERKIEQLLPFKNRHQVMNKTKAIINDISITGK